MRLQRVQPTTSGRETPASFTQHGPAVARPFKQALQRATASVWQAGGSAVAVALLAASLAHAQPAVAVAVDAPVTSDFPRLPAFMQGSFDRFRQQKLDEQARQAEADAAFQESSTLQELLARSRANRQKNLEELQEKYCDRSWLQCLEFMQTLDEDERTDVMTRR